MVTSSKREEAAMADTVTSPHGVAACPHWERTRGVMGNKEWYAVHCGALGFLETNNSCPSDWLLVLVKAASWEREPSVFY